MRPRPDAAENIQDTHAAYGPTNDASMRPRPDAAENGVADFSDEYLGTLQ